MKIPTEVLKKVKYTFGEGHRLDEVFLPDLENGRQRQYLLVEDGQSLLSNVCVIQAHLPYKNLPTKFSFVEENFTAV